MKRFLACLLCVCMALGLCVTGAGAVGNEAKVGTTEYPTLADAIAAVTDGSTVTLLSDISTGDSKYVISAENVTLDLNGKTVTTTADPFLTVNAGAGLTITDSGSNGTLYEKRDYSFLLLNKGTLTVDRGVFKAESVEYYSGESQYYGTFALAMAGGSTTTINGGEFTGFIYTNGTSENINVNFCGGVFNNMLYLAAKSMTVNISGGTFNGGTEFKGSIVNVTGGTFNPANVVPSRVPNSNGSSTNGGWAFAVVDNAAYGTVTATISAGRFNGKVELMDDDNITTNNNDTLSITGGTFAVKNDAELAAALTMPNANNYTIEAAPGTYSAAVSPWNQVASADHSIERTVTLLGANAANDPNGSGWSAGETVLTGGMYLGYDDSHTRDHTITVKGFTFKNKGLTVADQKNVVIENNKFIDVSGQDAIAVLDQEYDGQAGSVSVINNYIKNIATNHAGVNLRNPFGVIVAGNHIEDIGHNCLLIQKNSKYSPNAGTVSITGNTLMNWDSDNDCTGGRAIRADFVGNGSTSPAKSITFSGNKMVKTVWAANPADTNFVKFTGTGANTIDMTLNYWNSASPDFAAILIASNAVTSPYYKAQSMGYTDRSDFVPAPPAPEPTPVTTTDTVTNPDGSVTVTTTTTTTDTATGTTTEVRAQTTTDASGNVTATETTTVTTRDGSTAAATVTTDAAGKTSVSATVEAPKDSAAATVPAQVLNAVTEAGSEDTSLTVTTRDAELQLDAAAVAALAEKGGEAPVIKAEALDSTSLTSEQRAIVGDAPVIELTVNGGSVDFGSGTVSVSVNYSLKAGEKAEGMTAWFLNAQGRLEQCECVYRDGVLTFRTSHFSKYVLAYFPFTDVKSGAWYYENVVYAFTNNIFRGISDTGFGPDDTMTRQMIWTVLARMDGKTPADYDEAREWAMTNKISDGTTGAGQVTREELAAILFRYAGYKGMDVSAAMGTAGYPDAADISDWAVEGMTWAVSSGIINGSDGYLLPQHSALRCQVAAMLQRFMAGAK